MSQQDYSPTSPQTWETNGYHLFQSVDQRIRRDGEKMRWEVTLLLTGKKLEVLMVRREISSTLGRKRASCELEEERERRRSQGESWRDWLKKKDSLELKAMPKVKPSDLWILASAQGWYTLLVLVAITTTATSGSIINHNAPFTAIVEFGFDDDDGVVGDDKLLFFSSFNFESTGC